MLHNNNTPSIRFAGFTDAWEQRRLGDLCTRTTGGGTPRTGVSEYWDGEIPWFQSSDFKDGIISTQSSNKRISQEGLKESAAQLIPAQSVAIVARVGFGKLALIPFQYTTSQDILSLSNLTVDPLYGVYSIYKKLQSELMAVQGTSIKGVTKEDLLAKDITVSPNETEQQKIGDLFQKIDNLITLHQRKYDQLVNIKKSMLDKMFPKNGETVPEVRFAGFTDAWEQRELGEVCGSLEYGLNAAAKEYDGENKYIRITDIDDNTRLFMTSDLTSPDKNLKDAARYRLEAGDIVFARTGASVGKSYIYKRADGTVYYAGFLIRAKVKQEYSADFVFQNTLSQNYEKYILITSQRSGQPGVNAQEYAEYTFSVPEYEEQKKIGTFLTNLDTLITLHQRKLERLQNIKKACLEKMFV